MNPTTRPAVLIVTADALQRDLILVGLRALDAELIAAGDGRGALEAIRAHHPRLILLDLHLPDVNGLSLLQGLHSAGLIKRTAVIALSTLGYPEIVQQAAQYGATDFLLKPLDLDVLREKVGKVL